MGIAEKYKKDPNLFKELQARGIISDCHIRDLKIYNQYQSLKNDYPSKMQLYNKLSIDNDTSVETVRRAVKKCK